MASTKQTKQLFTPGDIKGPYSLLGAFLLIIESILIAWLVRANQPSERIAAGLIATVLLLAFLFLVYRLIQPRHDDALPTNEAMKAICGHWSYTSESNAAVKRNGRCEIKLVNGELELTGTFAKDSERVGTWHSEVARIRDNRLIFYYILKDASQGEPISVDAVSILVFEGDNPDRMEGDWIVVGREKKYGRVDYKKEP